MQHFVLMKFEEGFFTDAVFSEIAAAFDALQTALPGEILSHRMYRNCVQRPFNMDLMICLTLRAPESLERYLPHPLHTGIGKVMDPHVVSRCSFDHL